MFVFGLLKLVPTRLWLSLAAAIAVGVLLGFVRSHYIDMGDEQGSSRVQAQWNADRLETAKASLRNMEMHTRASMELQEVAERLRRERNASILSADLERAELLARLRDRPERPTTGVGGVPFGPGTGQPTGCTGAELYRGDGEFLARLSADAKIAAADARYCRAQYNSLKTKLDLLMKKQDEAKKP